MLTKDEIKTRIQIATVVEADLGAPQKESGNWLIYFCPFHTNTRTPALGVNQETGTFKCLSCQVQGDIFTWRTLREKEDFKQTLAWYRDSLGDLSKPGGVTQPPRKVASQHQPPSAQWQARGRAFVKYAQDQLWHSPVGLTYGLDELFRRQLKPETILFWGLGYNPAWISDDPTRWGLTPRAADHKVWLARGLVIPAWAEEQLWYLKIRAFGNDGRPVNGAASPGKYSQPVGGRSALWGTDTLNERSGAVLAESELDAILAWQEGRDLLSVASLGGAGKRLHARWLPYLIPYQKIFLAYDRDLAGQAGAQKITALSQRLVVWPPPHGDLISYAQGGGDLRALMVAMHTSVAA